MGCGISMVRLRCFRPSGLLRNLFPIRWRWIRTYSTLLATAFTRGQFPATFELLLSTSQTSDNGPLRTVKSLPPFHIEGSVGRRVKKHSDGSETAETTAYWTQHPLGRAVSRDEDVVVAPERVSEGNARSTSMLAPPTLPSPSELLRGPRT